MLRKVLLVAGFGLFATACEKQIEAPRDTGVCWHAVQAKDGQLKFNKVTDKAPNIETCAAALEAIRVKFLGFGGTNRNLVGAYQGSYLFVEDEGIFRAETLKAHRYIMLVRTGDGRLAMPGAMPQAQ